MHHFNKIYIVLLKARQVNYTFYLKEQVRVTMGTVKSKEGRQAPLDIKVCYEAFIVSRLANRWTKRWENERPKYSRLRTEV